MFNLSPATQYSMYAPTSYVESTGLSSLVGYASTVSRILVTADVLKYSGSGDITNIMLSFIPGCFPINMFRWPYRMYSSVMLIRDLATNGAHRHFWRIHEMTSRTLVGPFELDVLPGLPTVDSED